MGVKRWAWVLALAFALRALVGFVWLRSMPLVSDAKSYVDVASDLLVTFPGKGAYYWPPGNPFALAAVFAVFGESLWATRALMLVLGVAGVALTALIARQLDPKSETISGVLAALFMPAVLLVGQSYAQHLAAVCVLGVAYFGLRAVREGNLVLFAIAGLALGLGCLTRPSMTSLALVLFVAWLLELRATKSTRASLALGGAVAVVLAAAVVAPVLAHNRALGAGLTLSTNNERNVFLGNNPYTPDYKTSHLGQRSLDELDPESRSYLESFYARPDARQAMQHEAFTYAAHHPAVTAYRSFNRATSFWGFDYLASRLIQEDRGWGKRRMLPLLALEAGSYVLVMVLAIAGLFAFRDARDPFWARWLVWLVMAYELPYVLAFSGGTYHFPVVPLLIPFAGVAAARYREIATRVRASRGAILALIAFFAIQIEYAYYSMAMSG